MIFNIGDRVKVINKNSNFYLESGIIVSITGSIIEVEISDIDFLDVCELRSSDIEFDAKTY